MFDRFASADLKHGETNALVKLAGGAEKVRQILKGELKLIVTDPDTAAAMTTKGKAKSGASPKVLSGLLELIGEPVKVGANERFVASEKWVVDRDGELPISFLSDNIRTHFLGLVEENVPAATLKQRKLLKASVDTPIISGLGGQEKSKTAFAHVYEFLKTADRTKWYIFYVIGTDGNLWAVIARWGGDGWYVDAGSVSDPGGWRAGRHVVSR